MTKKERRIIEVRYFVVLIICVDAVAAKMIKDIWFIQHVKEKILVMILTKALCHFTTASSDRLYKLELRSHV